ncbi:MAG TPA: SUMF1/EgtB/PvdO family nonheme iron enzyme [Verrucomicrobiae bacterium]|nr:SUMF1/EgtB/PvdO family nonheme iron enzyme [Verrucomicrobiae bacterium]
MKTNKNIKSALAKLLIPLALAGGIRTALPAPIIVSLSPTGVLICTNLQPASVDTVESSASFIGPSGNQWSALSQWVADSNGRVQATVPVTNPLAFFRVVELPPPTFTADGMALVPAGSFTMGDSSGDGIPDAIPTNVALSAFYMDTNLVSYGQWRTIFGYATNVGYTFDNIGSAKNNATNQPVQSINWYDAVKWCNARSQKAGLMPVYYTDSALTLIYTNGDSATVYPNATANGYQLPTEAQWEKAARGGLSSQRFPFGNTISESQANYFSTNLFAYDLGPQGYNTNFNSGQQPYTSPVGYFRANGFGLNDMAGNVLEWCWDWYGTPYGQPTTNNPTGPTTGTFRITRGGQWGFYANIARTADRSPMDPTKAENYEGFRCVKNH